MGLDSKNQSGDMAALKASLMAGDEQARQQEQSRSVLQEAVHAAMSTVWQDNSTTKREVEKYTTEFVKSVPLFMGGRVGTMAATAAFGLDEVKTGDSFGMQAAELAGGMAKGYLTKRAFDYFGAQDWNFARKGISMGASARLLDSALTPANYFTNGHLDVVNGAARSIANAADGKALGMDVLTFGVAQAIPGAFGKNAFANHRLLESSLTGASFGFTSGSLGELQHQLHNGQPLDYGKILKSGALEGGVMGLAAGAGHTLSRPRAEASQRQSLDEQSLELRATTDGAGKGARETAGYTAFFLDDAAAAKVKNQLTVDGQAQPVRWTAPERLHVTESFGVKESEGNAWAQAFGDKRPEIRIVGHAVDATGVEALHVAVNGETMRADGKPYHITRSLAEGRKAAESGPMIEKALQIEAARKTGTVPEGMTAQDMQNFSYRTLKPTEQFDVSFEPRFRASDTTPKEVKQREPKPEIPFDQLSPKLQVISALKNTPADYFTRMLQTRTPENRAGSYFDMTPDQLKAELFKARWEPYNPVDGEGKPIIGGGAIGYRATIRGGRLGMIDIAAIPETAQLYLIDPKGINNWSVSTVGASEPHTDHVTMIVGKEPNDPHYGVWTFHPGEPVRPSALTAETIGNALSGAGVGTSDLPSGGPGRRIPITRQQLNAINAALPEGSQMTKAKVESEQNVK